MMLLENETVSFALGNSPEEKRCHEPIFPNSIKRMKAALIIPGCGVRTSGARAINSFSQDRGSGQDDSDGKIRDIKEPTLQYRGKLLTREDLNKVKRALIERCKAIISSNIKLEEPINFSKFFNEALMDACLQPERLGETERM